MTCIGCMVLYGLLSPVKRSTVVRSDVLGSNEGRGEGWSAIKLPVSNGNKSEMVRSTWHGSLGIALVRGKDGSRNLMGLMV